MKLASLKDGSRDGRLVIVSRDLTQYTDASFLVPTLQRALDDWQRIAPHLRALAQSLEIGAVPSQRFHEHDALPPLPRAYHRIGSGDSFAAARDDLTLTGQGALTPGFSAFFLDVPQQAGAAGAEAAVLVGLSAQVSEDGAPTATVFSPVVVTRDEVEAPGAHLLVSLNGDMLAKTPFSPSLGSLPSDALHRGGLSAGAVISAPLGAAHAVKAGDVARLEAKGHDGHSIFGAIEQKVLASAATPIAA